MPLYELPLAVAKHLLNYLENAKKRAEFVIKKKDRYDKAAVERAHHVVSLLIPVINSLKNPVGVSVNDAKPQQASEAAESAKKEEESNLRLKVLAIGKQVDSLLKDVDGLKQHILTIENRLRSWEVWKENTNAILKKLVAYHSGDLE